MKHLATAALTAAVAVALLFSLYLVEATVNVSQPATDQTNGITVPAGNYTSVYRINGQWYLNGQPYPSPSPTPTPSPPPPTTPTPPPSVTSTPITHTATPTVAPTNKPSNNPTATNQPTPQATPELTQITYLIAVLAVGVLAALATASYKSRKKLSS